MKADICVAYPAEFIKLMVKAMKKNDNIQNIRDISFVFDVLKSPLSRLC